MRFVDPSWRVRARRFVVFVAFAHASVVGCSQEVTGLGDLEIDEDDDDVVAVQRDAGRPDAAREPHDGDDGFAARDASPPDEGNAAPVDDAGGLASSCSFSGQFAMRIEFDVDWAPTRLGAVAAVAGGSGTLTVYALATMPPGDGRYDGAVQACGAEIPDFFSASALFPEQYGVFVADDTWDQPTMPRWPVSWFFACQELGCPVQSSTLDAWIGGEPLDPSAPIGANDRAVVAPRDVDNDGLPGLTLWMKGPDAVSATGGAYQRPLLGLGLRGRASRAMMGLAVRAHFGGQITSCDAMSGESNDGEVGAVAFGCMSQFGSASESQCDDALASVLDQNMPNWQVRSARYQAVRISEGNCRAVRQRFTSSP